MMCLRIVPLIALVLSYSPITKIAVELFSLNAPEEYFFGSPKECQDYIINYMKIGIVGCGMVGATSGFALVMNGVGREIIFVDINRVRAEAEANDILHAVPFAHPLMVRAGEYADLGSRIIPHP